MDLNQNVKTIEFYPNGTVKRMEFFAPVEEIPLWWQLLPFTVSSGSTSIAWQDAAKDWLKPFELWNSSEEDAAWSELQETPLRYSR